MGSCILAKLIFRLLSHSGLFWLILHEPFALKSTWEILICQSLGQKFSGYIWNEILTLLIRKDLTNGKTLNEIRTQKLLPHNHFLTANRWSFFHYLEAIQPKNMFTCFIIKSSLIHFGDDSQWLIQVNTVKEITICQIKMKKKGSIIFSVFRSRAKAKRDFCVLCYWICISRNLWRTPEARVFVKLQKLSYRCDPKKTSLDRKLVWSP